MNKENANNLDLDVIRETNENEVRHTDRKSTLNRVESEGNLVITNQVKTEYCNVISYNQYKNIHNLEQSNDANLEKFFEHHQSKMESALKKKMNKSVKKKNEEPILSNKISLMKPYNIKSNESNRSRCRQVVDLKGNHRYSFDDESIRSSKRNSSLSQKMTLNNSRIATNINRAGSQKDLGFNNSKPDKIFITRPQLLHLSSPSKVQKLKEKHIQKVGKVSQVDTLKKKNTKAISDTFRNGNKKVKEEANVIISLSQLKKIDFFNVTSIIPNTTKSNNNIDRGSDQPVKLSDNPINSTIRNPVSEKQEIEDLLEKKIHLENQLYSHLNTVREKMQKLTENSFSLQNSQLKTEFNNSSSTNQALGKSKSQQRLIGPGSVSPIDYKPNTSKNSEATEKKYIILK